MIEFGCTCYLCLDDGENWDETGKCSWMWYGSGIVLGTYLYFQNTNLMDGLTGKITKQPESLLKSTYYSPHFAEKAS